MQATGTGSARSRVAWLGLILWLLVPGLCHAAAAGRVIFTAGAPQAVDGAGAARALKRGDDVFSGETLVTDAAGRLQVSFADGAYISLQPDSRYAIEQYNYSGTQDGSEQAVYRLLKGGVRALTGAIGKQNPDAYRVETPVATIGIRGSGHNSRVCAGDCPGFDDGLYHSTWQGLTYVKNNVDERNVPFGRGVFVAGLDLPIVFLDRPPALTALDTGRQRERDQEEREDRQRRFHVGDQRDDDGGRVIIEDRVTPPVASSVLGGLGLAGIAPEEDHPDGYDTFSYSDVSLFTRDADEMPVAFLGLIEEDDGDFLEIVTIDPAAVRGGDDAATVATAIALLELADPALVRLFEQNPAHVEDAFFNGEFGLGRWTEGRVLVVRDGETSVPEFTGFQSAHFIFGPNSPALPTGGGATYDFLAGTRSTSVSGATIGDGVIGGSINVNFGSASANLNMDVVHDNVDYFVSGSLTVNPGDRSLFDNAVMASTVDPASGCYPSCQTLLDGGFAGPAQAGTPKYIGFEYEIQNTIDVITGVAGFQLQTGP